MFTSAGMVQFKNLFTGVEKRSYQRATTAQKCLRAGGKHNDLDNVGYTARHHTFFEMLGNFSFGDYFKADAIEHAWNLVTRTFQLNKDRLLVTVYHDDEEAVALWKRIAGLPESRIIRIATSDNFLGRRRHGPCGPCSGDLLRPGPTGSGAGRPAARTRTATGSWNSGTSSSCNTTRSARAIACRCRVPPSTPAWASSASRPSSGVTSNYDVDLMRTIIQAAANLTGVDPDGSQAASHRIVADHLRASAFLVADGIDPSNEGRATSCAASCAVPCAIPNCWAPPSR